MASRKYKKVKTKVKNKIPEYKIIEKIYTHLFKRATRNFCEKATPYFLGRDKQYIIRKAVKMVISRGCYAMPSISAGNLAKAAIEIVESKLIPCGLARCGHFGSGHDERADIVLQLRSMNKEAILLSFSSRDKKATLEILNARPRKRKFSIYVVPNEKKRKERR